MAEPNVPQIQLRSVVLDCADPPALARFYGELLGGEVREDPDWSEVHMGSMPFKLAFQRVDRYVSPEWPDGQPQQLHLDFTVAELAETSTRALALGARVLNEPVDEEGSTYQVHADPSGHPFCLVVELDRAD
jgi:predicted enzyme related to lactoylglutathione lyase